MPRQSQAALQSWSQVKGVTPLEVVPRLRPPAELTDEQRAEFLRVVGVLPADWFAPAHVALLVQYCRHVVMARKVGQLIDILLLEKGNPVEIDALVKRQESETRTIQKLMTGLRMTPQSI